MVRLRASKGVGIFPLSATVNHSCVPNCVVTFNRDFSAYVYARRNIAAGDELFHTYVQETDPLDVRRAELKVYGFDCVCSKCVREQAEAEKQDSEQATKEEVNK
jgi:SET domain-containing protein